MSKERETEYLEKLGVPKDDYSSVQIGKTFSIDDILGELGKQPVSKSEIKAVPAEENTEKEKIKPKVDFVAESPVQKPEKHTVHTAHEPVVPLKPEIKPEIKEEPKTVLTDEPTRPIETIKAVKPKRMPNDDVKLFSTIEIETPAKEYNVAVEEGGEPKVDGSTVVFAPTEAASEVRTRSRKRQPRKTTPSEAEPEQLMFEGAGPKIVFTTAKEEPVEKKNADQIVAGFGESIENKIKEEAKQSFKISGDEEENSESEEPEEEVIFDDYEEPDDFEPIDSELKSGRFETVFKSVFVAIATAVLFFLSTFTVLSPEQTGIEKDIAIVYLFISIAITVVIMLLCSSVVAAGFKQIFSFSLRAEGAAVLCCTAAILQNIILMAGTEYILDGTVGIYNYLPALMLLFIRLSDLPLIKHTRSNMEFVDANSNLGVAEIIDNQELADDITDGQISGEACVCAVRKTEKVTGIIEASKERGSSEKSLGKLFVFVFFASAAIAALSLLLREVSAAEAVSVFTAALCAGVPLMASFITIFPLNKINSKLNKKGCAIVNFNAAERIAGANSVVISDTDVFPANSIVLHGMSMFNNSPLDQALTDTISVLNAAGGALAKVFEGSVANQSILREIDSMQYADEMGMLCKSQGREILLGCREFMKKYQIPIPSAIYEDRMAADDRKIIYLAVDMKLSAMYIVSYNVSDVAKKRLRKAEDNGLTLLISTKDTNVTKEILSNRMRLDKASIKIIKARALDKLERKLKKSKSSPAGILVNDECCSLPEAVVGAARLRTKVAFNLASIIASSALGLIFVAFFALVPSASAIAAWKILLYALFWTLPTLCLSSSK